jgi:signal transduction histidine kinase
LADQSFARLVSLACHDLRTPLATVHGFARTLDRLDPLPPRTQRYLGMMEAASAQMAEQLEGLALVARIEAGRYEPALREVDSLELARSALELLEDEPVEVAGEPAAVRVDPEPAARAVASLAACALRFGDAPQIRIDVHGPELRVGPVEGQATGILAGDDLRDLGTAVARRLVEALGGTIVLEGKTLLVRLPAARAP